MSLATVLVLSGIKLADPPAANVLLGGGLAISLSMLGILVLKPRWQKRVARLAAVKQT